MTNQPHLPLKNHCYFCLVALYKIPTCHRVDNTYFNSQEAVIFDEIYLHHIDRHLTVQQTFQHNEKYSLFDIKSTPQEQKLFALIADVTVARVKLLAYSKLNGFRYHLCDCDRMISIYENIIKINDDRKTPDGVTHSAADVLSDDTQRPKIEHKFVSCKTSKQNDLICPIIHMDGDVLSYVNIKITESITEPALIDTGACGNALPRILYDKLKTNKSNKVGEIESPEFSVVKLASGRKINVMGQVKLLFSIGGTVFEENFLLLPEMNNIILGNPFFKKHGIDISPKTNLLKMPDLTIEMNSIADDRKVSSQPTKHHKYMVVNTKKTTIPSCRQDVLTCKLDNKQNNFENCSGVVESISRFEKKTGLCVLTSLSCVQNNNTLQLSVINATDHPITILSSSPVATFQILTAEQAEQLQPIDPQLIALAKMRNKDNPEEFNMLIRDDTFTGEQQPPRPPPNYQNLWFPTPETCSNPSDLSPVQQQIYQKLTELQRLEKMDPANKDEDREVFLNSFDWTTSVLTGNEKTELSNLLVDYADIFAKHRFDVGYNTEMAIKLTPEHSMPTYMQSPPTPIHLKDELLIELALMQYYDIITTLPNSKYSSPIFAHRKPSGKLRLLVDLRRINHLLRHDYADNNFPISNMTDSTNHFAGKKLFCKLDCSQAYHCIQMADDQSIQLLAFNFNSRTFAYRRLAQGLSKSVTGFSSFVRHYLDPCLAADLCTQFMDDIGCGANSFPEMISSLRKIFNCLRRAGLKLSAGKCQFGADRIHYLGNIITTCGIRPQEEKIKDFLATMRIPKSIKQVKRLIGFLQFFRSYIPALNDKLLPFYRLLRKTTQFMIENDHIQAFDSLRQDLLNATQTTLRLAKPGKQFVILCDASYHGTGFVLMIEDYINTKKEENVKMYAPVSFGSKLFNSTQLKFSIYCKEFLSLYFALEQFAHFVWCSEKPVIVLTDNKSLVRFFQAKNLPPTLWNYLDRVLSFNIVLAHIPGTANHAADYLSRMETNPNQTIQLKLSDHIPIRHVEVNLTANTPDVEINNLHHFQNLTEHSGIPKEVTTYLQQVGKLHLIQSELSRKNPSGTQEITHLIMLKHKPTTLNALIVPNPLDTSDIEALITTRESLPSLQKDDETIKQVKEWITIGSPIEPTYRPFELQKYAKQLSRLVIENDVLYRNFYDDSGKVKYRQFCVPKHLRQELIYRIHNSPTAGHQGIVKTIEEFRKRFYFPGFTEYISGYIKNCLSCAQLKNAPNATLRPNLGEVSTTINYPAEMMQIDIVGPFQSYPYRYVLTGIDVFTKYLFAKPLTTVSAKAVATALVSMFFTHSYLPETLVCDLGSVFTSKLFEQLTQLLEIRLRHATLKHPQTIGTLERAHGALKRILKLNTDLQWNNWYKYVDLAAFVHNTSYHSSIGTTPSSLFHGRHPNKPLDLRFTNKKLNNMPTEIDYVNELQNALLESYAVTKERLTTMYNKYRWYYDQKAKAKPLKVHSYCMLLNPLLCSQSDFSVKHLQAWLPLYRIEKVLTDSNYIIRKVGTVFTQCVHRIRLRPIVPQYEVNDIPDVSPDQFQPDPTLSKFRGEPELFQQDLEHLS